MEKKFNSAELIIAMVAFGVFGGFTALIKGIHKKHIEKKYGWVNAWKVDPNNLPEGSNIFLDVDKQKLINYDTGEVLEDFSLCEDPKKAMTDFMNLIWSLK